MATLSSPLKTTKIILPLPFSAIFGIFRQGISGHGCSLARGLPNGPSQNSLDDFISQTGHGVSEYTVLRTYFWPKHPKRGEPDLLVSFEGPGLRPITLVIEAKLWSGKSGNKEDQLVRYLKILDELQEFPQLPMAEGSLGALVYLTPRESLDEVLESLKLSPNLVRDRARIFRLQWQDFIRVCDETFPTGEDQIDTILRDVGQLLQRRGLEYFAGFRSIALIPELRVRRASFSKLFVRLKPLLGFAIRRAPWMKDTLDTENRLVPL